MIACLLLSTLVTWQFPRTASCHEGLPFADGRTGVLVWGGGETINMTIGRGDLWDHRGGYAWTREQNYDHIVELVRANDAAGLKSLFSREVPEGWGAKRYNPYMLPLGRVTLTLDGASLARGELETSTGLGRLLLADGREIALAFAPKRHVFALKLPRGLNGRLAYRPSTDFPIYDQLLKGRHFERAVKRADGFDWNLPADEPVSVTTRTRHAADGDEICLWTTRPSDPPSTDISALAFEEIVRETTAHWRAFWRAGARVRLPDAVVQEIFDFGMYKFGAMTDPSGIPAGLQGQWLEDDRLVPWCGDYHFNINVQECYSPAYRGGHLENLKPLFRMILSWRPRLRENAKLFVGIPDGYILPHSVDDRGVCIGGFWTGTIDHASTAWMASMMMRYVRYSGDTAFLREGAYDFMKGAMNVYLAMMKVLACKLTIPCGPSPEWGGDIVSESVGRDPSFQLAAAHRLATDLIDAAKLLGETPDVRWADVNVRLPDYSAGEGGIELFEGQPFTHTHRHHSHLAGFYPFDTLDLADKQTRADAVESYRTWVQRGTGEWTGWCVPWAAILHTHFGYPDAAVQMLHNWKVFFNNPGHGSLHDAYRKGFSIFDGCPEVMQMDGACAAATAIMELLAHETHGRVEFFKGCPEEWREVSFENLALSDGRRVNGRRLNGKIEIHEAQSSH